MPEHSISADSRCVDPQPPNSSIVATTVSFRFTSLSIRISDFRQSGQTALVHYSPFGWAEISHPFHPLRGRRFEVLKKRRIAGVDTLILRERERGTLSVPREWTDWADPSPDGSSTVPPHRLAADCLFELVVLLEALPASRAFSPGKDPLKKD
jgi:hypothetical protein